MEAQFVVHSLVGFFLLHSIAWALSEDRGTVAWRPVIAGMLLTFGLGLLLLKAPYAMDREGLFARPGEDDGCRRRDRLVLCGKRVRRHGRGPPGRQALYPEHEPW